MEINAIEHETGNYAVNELVDRSHTVISCSLAMILN